MAVLFNVILSRAVVKSAAPECNCQIIYFVIELFINFQVEERKKMHVHTYMEQHRLLATKNTSSNTPFSNGLWFLHIHGYNVLKHRPTYNKKEKGKQNQQKKNEN